MEGTGRHGQGWVGGQGLGLGLLGPLRARVPRYLPHCCIHSLEACARFEKKEDLECVLTICEIRGTIALPRYAALSLLCASLLLVRWRDDLEVRTHLC